MVRSKTKHEINGWKIEFNNNIHMYTHSLKVFKNNLKYDIPCEDTPMQGNIIGIWIYELKIDKIIASDLKKTLMKWADICGYNYILYFSKNDFETNVLVLKNNKND